jgi:hypothetical protein
MTARRASTFAAMTLAALAAAAAPAAAQRGNRDLITREEVLQSANKDKNLYEAIKTLRPRFFEMRGNRTLGNAGTVPIAAYVDRAKLSDLEALKSISASDIHEVRYIEPSRAESEYGPQAASGAIVVKMFKVVKPTDAPKDTIR